MNESKETNRLVFSFKREDDKTATYTMNKAKPTSDFPWSMAGTVGRTFINYQVFDPTFTGSKLKSLEKIKHVNTITKEFNLDEA